MTKTAKAKRRRASLKELFRKAEAVPAVEDAPLPEVRAEGCAACAEGSTSRLVHRTATGWKCVQCGRQWPHGRGGIHPQLDVATRTEMLAGKGECFRSARLFGIAWPFTGR